MGASINLIAILGILAVAGFIVLNSGRRRASDVVSDLRESFEDSNPDLFELNPDRSAEIKKDRVFGDRELFSIGLYEPDERESFRLHQKLIPLGCAGALLFLRFIFGFTSVFGAVIVVVMGISFGYLYSRRRIENLKREHIKEIEFFLPVVMERLVMAVQAGLDIIPALSTLGELDKREAREEGSASLDRSIEGSDSVSRLLSIVLKLTESGLSLQQSLRDVANEVNSPSLRHAFIHLGMAQEEGGELVSPLRELSDSTQLYFQESVEEDIAKLPVKATAPLLLTFGGLIICFLTTPLIQIITITARASLNGETP